jgi:alcohol dehydrogenase
VIGNTIDGAQAEYLRVPYAQANLAKIPDELTDEQVVLLADIASTGISAAESADLQIGDTAAVFAQGPIGLGATAGAKLKGASLCRHPAGSNPTPHLGARNEQSCTVSPV